jgi:hypothetical protein
MADMNIQGVDPVLVREFKIHCIQKETTMKDMVTKFMELSIAGKIDIAEQARLSREEKKAQ